MGEAFYTSAIAEMKTPIWISFVSGNEKLSIEIPTAKNKRASQKSLDSLKDVCTRNKGWITASKFWTNVDMSALGILNEVARYFAPERDNVRIICMELSAHFRGGKYNRASVASKDDEYDTLATVMVSLPLGFKGGDMVIKAGGKEEKELIHSWHSTEINWVAYAAGYWHNIGQITNGTCVLLTYELVAEKSPVVRAKKSLRYLLEDYEAELEEGSVTLGFACRQEYPEIVVLPHEGTSDKVQRELKRVLKGTDAAIYFAAEGMKYEVEVVRVWRAPEIEGESEADMYIDREFCGFEESKYVHDKSDLYRVEEMVKLGKRPRSLEHEHGGVEWKASDFRWMKAGAHPGSDDTVTTVECAAAILVTIQKSKKKRSRST